MTEGKCEVCKEGSAKYKCPVCLIKFCCVACYKTHKGSDNCVKPEPACDKKPVEDQEKVYEYETEDTVTTEKLNLLGLDKKVRNDLENRHLQQLLEHINSSQNPDKSIGDAMKDPVFCEFARHCLQVVDE